MDSASIASLKRKKVIEVSDIRSPLLPGLIEIARGWDRRSVLASVPTKIAWT
jgi:hypothetical protein